MIHLDRRGPVARLTLDRPAARNALDGETVDALAAALDTLAADPTLRVLVLTGAGDRVFCAGADLAALAAFPEARREAAARFGRLAVRLATFPRPVVVRVNGACVAGGMALFLAGDLAVCHEGVHFALPEGNVGMWPMVVGALLRRCVGERVALDLALTARKVDAAEALRLGLVNRVVPAEALDAEVDALCAAVARMSPKALRLGRQAWRDAAALDLPEAVDLLAGRLGELMDSPDATEGFLAFVQKRDPAWSES